MRDAIIVGTIIGAFFFMATAAMTAVAVRYATPTVLWDVIFWAGIAGMIMSATSLALFVSSQVYGRPLWMPAALINLGICFFVFGLVWHFQSEAKPSSTVVAALDNTIAISCAWSMPPVRYREDKTLHIVDFQGVPISGIDFNRQSAEPSHFVRSSEPFHPAEFYSSMWYRCDVTNHGPQPIRSLGVKFPVVYNAVVPLENGTRSGEMIGAGFARSPTFDLASGETDYFYFANASAAFVTVLPPSTALLQTMADDTVHEVRVITSSSWQVALMPSSKPLNANDPRVRGK
jgi:hypothetical protein